MEQEKKVDENAVKASQKKQEKKVVVEQPKDEVFSFEEEVRNVIKMQSSNKDKQEQDKIPRMEEIKIKPPIVEQEEQQESE